MNLVAIFEVMGTLKAKDQIKLNDIEFKLKLVKNTYENLLPIFSSIQRKKMLLELDIKMLEQEKAKIFDSQMAFDAELGF